MTYVLLITLFQTLAAYLLIGRYLNNLPIDPHNCQYIKHHTLQKLPSAKISTT